jgi:polar amino acid transport system substrate-binding protein
MRALFLCNVAVVIAGAGSAQENPPSPLRILTWELPPYHFQLKGEPVGFAYDVTLALAERTGTPVAVEFVPFARGGRMVRQEEGGKGLLTLLRTPDREDQYFWIGPLIREKIGVLVSADSPVKTLEEAREQPIGVVSGTVMHQFMVQENFAHIETAEDALNFQRLLNGRLGGWAAGELVARRMVASYNLSWQTMRFIQIRQVEPYIAFNRATDPDLVRRWSQAFERMRQDGSYRKIVQTWGLPELTD